MDAFSGEHGDRFLPNFIIVLGVHLALVSVLWIIASRAPTPPVEQITWLDGAGLEAPVGTPAASAAQEQELPALPPEPEPESKPAPTTPPEPTEEEPAPELPVDPPKPEPEELTPPKPTPTPAPKATPTPTPTPRPKSTPTPVPQEKPKTTAKTTPKPTAKPAPVRKPVAKATPKPAPVADRTAATSSARTSPSPASSAQSGAGTSGGAGSPGTPGGSITGTEVQSYFKEVSNCYRQVWEKPLTVIATGNDLTAIVRLRVNASGEVLSSTLRRPTGNREVDASIEAAFPKFRKVPPPPAGLLRNGIMEENMAIIYDL